MGPFGVGQSLSWLLNGPPLLYLYLVHVGNESVGYAQTHRVEQH